jgi:predicted lipoprotein with Yx(FWY)xxD motif
MSILKKTATPFVAILSFSAALSVNAANDYSTQSLPTSFTITQASVGKILANEKGLSVYSFDKDKKGLSKCYGACATNWPPVLTGKSFSEGKFSTTKRTDGAFQVQYNNKPLYLWIGDKKSGDINGDNIKGVWHIVKM